MADEPPVMANVQGKLKVKIVFDPTDKSQSFQSYRTDMEEYLEEFCVRWVVTEAFSAYEAGDDGGKPLKRYNSKATKRYIISGLVGDAEAIARAHPEAWRNLRKCPRPNHLEANVEAMCLLHCWEVGEKALFRGS
jgi:hypothetical protein